MLPEIFLSERNKELRYKQKKKKKALFLISETSRHLDATISIYRLIKSDISLHLRHSIINSHQAWVSGSLWFCSQLCGVAMETMKRASPGRSSQWAAAARCPVTPSRPTLAALKEGLFHPSAFMVNWLGRHHNWKVPIKHDSKAISEEEFFFLVVARKTVPEVCVDLKSWMLGGKSANLLRVRLEARPEMLLCGWDGLWSRLRVRL